MKALLGAVFVSLFVAISPVTAQSDHHEASKASAGSATTGKKIVMVGCIYAKGENYLLFSYKQSGGVELQGEDLKSHLGQKVKIHGTMLGVRPGSEGSKVEGNADDQVKQEKHVASHEPENGPLQVSKITTLSQTCDKKYRESAEKQLGRQNP